MPVICPSVTANNTFEFHQQINKVAHFAHRVHIDLSDGIFAPHKLVGPEDAWWPVGLIADFHLMYRNPVRVVHKILEHQPHMIIVHAEANGDFEDIADLCHQNGIKVGVALLSNSSPKIILPALDKIDHVLIFSGDLGKFGGHVNFNLLTKVEILKHQKPSLEIGWDGGINQHNVSQLVFGGVDVLNVGGYIQHSVNPDHAYKTLERIADETGTT